MIPMIGLASGQGAGNPGCGQGPHVIKEHLGLPGLYWHSFIVPQEERKNCYDAICEMNSRLAQEAKEIAQQHPFFFSFGGDHSSAIGLFSGLAEAKRGEGDIGLIWIDAHMDAHTTETSPSGNIHGMPLAALLGHGDPRLTSILSDFPKVKPENVVLIGIRSFEEGEANLLKALNVRTYFMEEVHERGIASVLREAVMDLSTRTVGYGVSFDLDSIDPSEAAAVGTPVEGGILTKELFDAICIFEKFPPLAMEIVEYNPLIDFEGRSFLIIEHLISRVCESRNNKILEEHAVTRR